MKPNTTFVRVCSFGEVPRNRGRSIMLDSYREVALFNIDGEIFAVDNICPHQHAPLIADGDVENCTVRCPLHGNIYDLRSGRLLEATGPGLRTYQVRRDGDDLLVEKPETKPPRWMA